MANEIEDLKDIVEKLKSRVEYLESKLPSPAATASVDVPKSIRMVLMGPPGAGKFLESLCQRILSLAVN